MDDAGEAARTPIGARPVGRPSVIGQDIQAALRDLPGAARLINEAQFGYRYVRPYLERLSPGQKVLEIGSGPGVLLAQIRRDFPHLEVTGVEPIGPGFNTFRRALDTLRDEYRFELARCGYEDLPTTPDCDLIFLINVFEHLADWRHFLRFARARLAPGGACVILCPNYGFPYESHFSIPVILNKSVTRRLFRSAIERHEEANDAEGLWDSLNFVKWSQVQRFSKEHGMGITIDPRILGDLVRRLDEDPEFAGRQQAVASLARLAMKTGVVRLFETGPMQRFLPYMLLEVPAPSKTDTAAGEPERGRS